jgi:hypothetical protein
MALKDAYAHLGLRKAIPTDAATTDYEIDMPCDNFVVKSVTCYNANGNNATATLGVYASTGGQGAVIVADAALTTHTTAAVVSERTVAATAITPKVTADKLYVRIGTGSGVAGSTIDVIVHGYALP